MKKFKVYITLAVSNAEESAYHTFGVEAENKESVFLDIVKNDWFKHDGITKIDGVEKETATYIQVKHITDIYIREI